MKKVLLPLIAAATLTGLSACDTASDSKATAVDEAPQKTMSTKSLTVVGIVRFCCLI
jgi:predicted small lipoprotein YifL